MAAASPDLGTGPTNQQGPSPQTGSTTPTGQVIGPLPASTMPGQLAQAIPTMANFQFLLGVVNGLQTQINNLTPGGAVNLTAIFPIVAAPPTITNTGVFSHGASGVVPGQYGDATHVAQTTFDTFGHATNVVNVPIASSGTFIQADYVVYPAHNAGLTSDRLLTAGTNITITDGGAKGPVTINATPSTSLFDWGKAIMAARTYYMA